MVRPHVLSCFPLCLLAMLGSARAHGLRPLFSPPAPADQELQNELRPGAEPNEPAPPPLLPPYLFLPMFRHQPAPLTSKSLFRPFIGSRMLPSDLGRILVPHESQVSVVPARNNRGVAVLCGHSKIQVRVNQALLGFRSSASNFWLGTCPVSRIDGYFLFFMYDLNDCGSSLSVVDGQFVYSNKVTYRPDRQDAVIRAVPLTLPITCAYNRFHYSYKIGYVPEPVIQTFWKKLGTRRIFSLSVRNERWEMLAVNESYALGEPMYFEASVDVLSHGESVFVEACHATLSNEPYSTPHHDVISNFGCLMDSRRTGSRSHFILRQMNILRFSLDAFLFPESTSERFYLHCNVLVGSSSVNPAFKSCTYSEETGRWEELDGDANVCSCCESVCESTGHGASSSQSEQALVTSEALSLNLSASRQDGTAGQVEPQELGDGEEVVEGVQEEVLIGAEDYDQEEEDDVLERNNEGITTATQQEHKVEEKLLCAKVMEEEEPCDMNNGNLNQEN